MGAFADGRQAQAARALGGSLQRGRALAGAGATRPHIASTQFLISWGRSIMSFWNDQGADMPQPGEVYRTYWVNKFRELDGAAFETIAKWTAVADDVPETLQMYQATAQAWFSANPGTRNNDHPPPDLQEPEPFIDIPSTVGFVKWVAIAIGGVALLQIIPKRS